MADAPRSSFIPKQTKSAVSSRVHKKRTRFNTLGTISTVLLIASVVLAGGMYFYRNYVEKELTEEKQALADERGRFSESDIARVRELDRRFAAAEYLLAQHTAPSKLFEALELTTKRSIQFTGLTFSRLAGNNISLTIEGATEEFKSVALQALQFSDDPILGDMVFTGLSNNEETTTDPDAETDPDAPDIPPISFNVTGTLRSGTLSYDGVVAAEQEEQDLSTSEVTATGSPAVSTSTDSTPEAPADASVSEDE